MFNNIAIKIYDDELPKSQFRQIEVDLLEVRGIPIKNGRNSIKQGKGELGSPNNPIPVNGIRGEFIYINRLKSRIDGSGYLFHRLCSYFSESSGTPVDMFELVSKTGKDWRQICLSPYYSRRSRLAPSFATFEPFAEDNKNRYPEKCWNWDRGYANGTYYTDKNFPNDLAKLYRDTIFNFIKLKGPYEPFCLKDGLPIFKCATQIHINQSHINDLMERASSMAKSIEDTVATINMLAMENKLEYLNTQRDYYSSAIKDSTLIRLKQASAPN